LIEKIIIFEIIKLIRMEPRKLMLAAILLVFSFFAGSISAFQDDKTPDKILGLWEVGSGKARVKMFQYGNKFGGKIVWLKEPNYPDGSGPKVDKNNPDESLRKKPLLGYTNLSGFEAKGDGKYEGGTIYDPENGSTYNCVITMTDENTLEVRGYIGVSLFGRTDTWKRVVVKK
jgi:uncharacterized protein (DUF2147 family)